ncbi:ETS-related transcription factor Elf-1-like [Pristis pectinata]|uniref:ETS-related transcription factor Elf-1-like n=1 Tax=Pristis pectinata TaxID=685728 RepID=UPI00223DF4F7|nr:ETS-related transcription factor Elf-1-like [Pristis pectinata]XP_051882568.1 ETS-related transcription factor Elf-1-like [Pristis pectinata]XP_051882569.1 ETS-related transcription factor Elf-1-like [Pristis pectinata]XP_051882570.1 ETS-related transcription factor Elf-1-like [Pristis pectinata]XP_051882571.1 ETS-related transcription factor Elf-1-like [Pristis pectinata]
MATAVGQNELVFEFASNDMENAQEVGGSCIFPAVIVEQVPNADLLQDYSGLACDEETNGMINDSSLDVVEEQVIGEEITVSVEASCQNGEESMETIEAAEALLNMDSPGPALEERRITHVFMPSASGVITAPITHISVRADGVPEVVENAEEIILMEETAQQEIASESLEQTKKRKGRKLKPPRPASPVANPDFPVKRKNKDGKGNTIYLWEFLLALLQDKNTCPRYIKWTQREKGIFKLVDSKAVSRLWGKHKNKPDMNYETMGRALRYYYQRGILAKVEGQRLVYQFKEMPKNLICIDDDDPSSISEARENPPKLTTYKLPTASETPSSATVLPSVVTSCIQTQKPRVASHVMSSVREASPRPSTVVRSMKATYDGEAEQGSVHLLSPEMLKDVQPLHKVQQPSVLKTVQVVHSAPPHHEEQKVTGRNVPFSASMTPSTQSVRTIKTPSQVPVVVSPGAQRLGTVTLQTVPLTTVITSTDLAMSSPKFIFQTVPSSHQGTVLKENFTLQGDSLIAKIVTPSSLAVHGASSQQVLPTSPQLPDNTTQAVSLSNTVGAATPVVTFAATSQQVMSQPQGTVFTSVIKAPETKQPVIQTAAKQEDQKGAMGTSQQSEHRTQQSHVIVLTNTAMLPNQMLFGAGEHREVDTQ